MAPKRSRQRRPPPVFSDEDRCGEQRKSCRLNNNSGAEGIARTRLLVLSSPLPTGARECEAGREGTNEPTTPRVPAAIEEAILLIVVGGFFLFAARCATIGFHLNAWEVNPVPTTSSAWPVPLPLMRLSR